MARMSFAVIFALTLGSALQAQPAPIDPPVAGRPVDFSNIVGRYEVKASAAPTIVPVEKSILLKIEIIGQGPAKYEPTRSSLKLIPASWENDFYIHDMPNEDRVMRDQNTWLFVYRLKPKNAMVKAIPLITLHYYDPTQPEKNRFQREYAGPIPLTVTPKLEPDSTIVTVDAVPESFYARAGRDEVLGLTPRYELDVNRCIAWLVFPPLFGWFTIWLYGRVRPDRKELTRRHQKGAAKRALARLATASPWNVVASYLQERLDFPALDAAPKEVADFLTRRGFARSLCRQSQAFFEACDSARFTDSFGAMRCLSQEAARLIDALEADPCVRA
jgi:hypothetical protein